MVKPNEVGIYATNEQSGGKPRGGRARSRGMRISFMPPDPSQEELDLSYPGATEANVLRAVAQRLQFLIDCGWETSRNEKALARVVEAVDALAGAAPAKKSTKKSAKPKVEVEVELPMEE